MAEPSIAGTDSAIASTAAIVAEEREAALAETDLELEADLDRLFAGRRSGVAPVATAPPTEPAPSGEDPELEADLDRLFSRRRTQQPTPSSIVSPGVGRYRLGVPQPSGGVPSGRVEYGLADAALESPIPGLELAGARIMALPPELSEEVPTDILEKPGLLDKDELSSLWFETVSAYKATKEPAERVQILGAFMRRWDPDMADRMGFTKEGYEEPAGVWKALDVLDKYTRRPLAAITNTLFDLRKWDLAIAASDGEIEGPDASDVRRMIKRNYSEDKGTIEDMAAQLSNVGAYIATTMSSAPVGMSDKEYAKKVLENLPAMKREVEDEAADWFTRVGYTMASPLLKLTTGASDEEIQRSIEESIEQGSVGGHFAYALAGGMALDPANAFGIFSKARVAKDAGLAARSLASAGIDLSPRGVQVAERHAQSLLDAARGQLLDDVTAIHGAEATKDLRSIDRRIRQVDDTVLSYEGRLAQLEGLETGAQRAVSRERIAESLPKLQELKARLVDEFDEAYDAAGLRDQSAARVMGLQVPQFLPAKTARAAMEARVSLLAVSDFNNAVDVAWRFQVPLAGDFAVGELSRLRVIEIDSGLAPGFMDRAWADGLNKADAAGEILVSAVVGGGETPTVRPITKSPEVADLYRRALDGELGDAARVAAQRPQYDTLETLLKKGVKGQPTYDTLLARSRASLESTHGLDKTLTGTAVEAAAREVYGTLRTEKSLGAPGTYGGIAEAAFPKAGRAAVKRIKATKFARGEGLVGNMDPSSFLIAHAFAQRLPWLDKYRRTLSGLVHSPVVRKGLRPGFGDRPQLYAKKVNDRWEPIPRERLTHPVLNVRAQKLERARIRGRRLLEQRWPQIEAEIRAILTDPEELKLARHFVESGVASGVDVAQLEKELFAAAGLRTLNKKLQEVIETLTTGLAPGTLSAEDAGKVVRSIAALRRVADSDPSGAAFPGIDDALIDDLIGHIEEITGRSAELDAMRSARADMRVKAPTESERMDSLKKLKERVAAFGAVYDIQVTSQIGLNAELEIARRADEFQPELQSIQETLVSLEERLGAKIGDELPTQTLDDFVESALAEAKGTLGDEAVAELGVPAVADEAAAELGAVEAAGAVVTAVVEGKHPPRLAALIESGRYVVRDLGAELDKRGKPTNRRLYEYRAKGTEDWPTVDRVVKDPDTGETLGPRTAGSYDPELAVVSYTESKWGTDVSFSLKEGLLDDIPQDDALMYRGMSWEEFESVRSAGEIKSLGEYNLGPEQEGLTYFTSDAGSGAYYASGFAPVQYKPVPEKPAVVVSVRKREGVPVAGTGEHEIGIRGSIPVDEIVDVWVGRPYRATTGKTDVIDDFQGFRDGSGVGPDSTVAWKKEELSFSPTPPKGAAGLGVRPVSIEPRAVEVDGRKLTMEWDDGADGVWVRGEDGKQVGVSRVKGWNKDPAMSKLVEVSKVETDKLRRLFERFGDAPVEKGWITEVDYSLRRKGLGVAMYEFAIDALRKRHPEGFYFMPSHYGVGDQASIKPGAVGVWKSLSRKHPSEGLAIYVGPSEVVTDAWKAQSPSLAPSRVAPYWLRRADTTLSQDEHLAVVKAALKRGDKVPIEVLLDYPAEVIGRVHKELKSDLLKIKNAQGEYASASRALDELMEKGGLEDASDLAKSLRSGALKIADDRVRKAERALRKLTSPREFARLRRIISRVKKAKSDKDLVIPVGSPERQTLEAMRELYRNRMASIVGQLEDEAALVREGVKTQRDVLLRGILPKEQLTPAQKTTLSDAIDELKATMLGPEPKAPAIPRERTNKLLKKLASEGFSKEIARLRRKIAAESDPAKRAVLSERMERKFSDILVQMEARVAEGVVITSLDEAIAAIRSGYTKVAKGLPGEMPKRDIVSGRLKDLEAELDGFIKALDDLDYDLRSPKERRADLTETINSSVNVLEASSVEFFGKLGRLEEWEAARILDGMSQDEIARVTRMVKNPEFHDLFAATAAMVERLASEKGRLIKTIERMEAEGKDVSRQKRTLEGTNRRLEILGDPERVEEVVKAANLMRGFFERWFEDLKSLGVLGDLDLDDFFARVDVAAYIPHMLSEAGRKKIASLKARGLVSEDWRPGFAKNRKIGGLIDDINIRKRDELTASIVEHQALRGKLSLPPHLIKDAQEAAVRGELRGFFDDLAAEGASKTYDEIVEEARIRFGMDDVYDFFETDPMVLMERYNSFASRAMADAAYIEDVLDLFPMGRRFSGIPGGEEMARRAGYVRLDKISQLEGVLRMKLPKGLRELEPVIRRMMDEGSTLDEVMAEIAANGIDVGADVISSMRGRDVYVPESVADYLNWMNSSDAAYANSVFGKMADGIHSWMKAQSTIIAFAHIARNFIGNVISSSQELGWAAINPVTQVQTMLIWGAWGNKLDVPVTLGGHTLTRRQWRQVFQERGFYEIPLSTDFMNEQLGLAGMKTMPTGQEMLIQTGAALAGAGVGIGLGAMFGIAPAGAFAGTALGVAAGAKWSGLKAVRGGKALERFVKMSSEEISKAPSQAVAMGMSRVSGAAAGALIGSVGGPAGAIAGAIIGGATMPDYLKMMGSLNTSVEAQARLSMGVAAIKKGRGFDEALDSVNAALRDYSDLTPFEKNVLRRVFFFYTWEAGNLKFQLDWLRKHPRIANSVGSFVHALYKQQYTESEIASVPDQYKYRFVMKMGGSKIIALSGLPWEPVLDILTRGERMPLEGVITRLHPGIVTFMEAYGGGGRSVYYNKGWNELNNVRQLKNTSPMLKWAVGFPTEDEVSWEPVYEDGIQVGTKPVYRAKNPELFYLMQRFPGWRVMSQYMALAADSFNTYALDAGDATARATRLERMLMFGMGYKITMIDWEQQKQYAAYRLQRRLTDGIRNRKRRVVRRAELLNPTWNEDEDPLALPLPD